MSLLEQYPEKLNSKDVQIWNNAAFDNGELSDNSKFSWCDDMNMKMKLLSSSSYSSSINNNVSESYNSDYMKENKIPSMVDMEESSPVSLMKSSLSSSSSMKPLQDNNFMVGSTKKKEICKVGVSQKKSLGLGEERNNDNKVDIDVEIEAIEKEIDRLSTRLESLRLEKAKRNAKVMEKRGRIVAAKFMDPPKQSNELSKFEDSMDLSAKLRTPRRGLSMGPTEIMRGMRRGISLGPAEIYSASKMKQLGKMDGTTPPVQQSGNRRKSCYWKLNEIDELKVTKERGKSMSLSPKSRSKTAVKGQVPKQAVTTGGGKKSVKKDEGVIMNSIQPKKLFTKDVEKSGKKPVKSGRVVASRYNQVSNVSNSGVKELRKRSWSENEEDCNRSDKKRVSLVGKCQGGEVSAVTEVKVKKRWEIPSEVMIQKNVSSVNVGDHKTPLSVSKMLDFVPKIKNLRCINESPRDSGAAKRVSELVGKKSFFSVEDGIDEEVEEPVVCQALSFAEEDEKQGGVEEYPKIRIMRHIDESPRDSGAAKRVSQLVGRKSFFNVDDEDEMPVLSFEEEDDGEEN